MIKVWRIETTVNERETTFDSYIVLAENFGLAIEKFRRFLKENGLETEFIKSCEFLELVNIE